ncbi:MAG: mandelate racemase/muconate lactonizing enzyme family protein [Alphaproteobacteria bacterium]
MKIASIEAVRLYPKAIKEAWADDEYVWPSRMPCFLVKVTAEDGTMGVGEATSQVWYLGETAEQIESCLSLYDEALRGQDPANFARAHQLMEAAYSGAMPGGRGARSGVDMALYDLVGKARGVPVHALLGGAYRTELELLTNLYHKTPEAMAAACQDFVGRGFTGLKVKVGDVLLARGFGREAFASELAKLEAALEVTPAEVYIDADANQGWESAQWTVTKLRRFAGHDNLSIEQPLHYADLSGAAFVREHAGVPVILDESAWSPRAVLELARLGACDRIVLKLNRLGGFFPAMQAVAVCESAAIGVSVDTNPYTLLGDTACCHIAAAIRSHYPVDCEGHLSFIDLGAEPLFSGGITFAGGRAHLPDAPGLGVEVDWAAVARHTEAGGQT